MTDLYNLPPRAICMRETDENFYVAVDRPFREGGARFEIMKHMAPYSTVRYLEQSGSQVFVYPRHRFTRGINESSTELLRERVFGAADSLGSILLDPTVERVEDKIAPEQHNFVRL